MPMHMQKLTMIQSEQDPTRHPNAKSQIPTANDVRAFQIELEEPAGASLASLSNFLLRHRDPNLVLAWKKTNQMHNTDLTQRNQRPTRHHAQGD
jgi:hypothetical protein